MTVKLVVASVSGGTPAFFAPEMCQAGAYNGVKADLWALGVSLCVVARSNLNTRRVASLHHARGVSLHRYLVLFAKLPYEAATAYLQLAAIRDGELQMPEAPAVSADGRALLRRLLVKSPTERARLKEVCAHRWMLADAPAAQRAALLEHPTWARIKVTQAEADAAIRQRGAVAFSVVRAAYKFRKRSSTGQDPQPVPDQPKDAAVGRNLSLADASNAMFAAPESSLKAVPLRGGMSSMEA